MEDMAITSPFWRGRRVFLTGHTGFKGGWLALWLQELGAMVAGYALEPPTQPSLFVTAAVADGMQSIMGDVQNLADLQTAMGNCRPEIVIHMAAASLVRRSYLEPVQTFSTNVMGTVHVLEAVQNCPTVRAVLIITSDKCYENREWLWGYRENEALGGHDPYSSSKACAEIVVAAYRRSFFSNSGPAVASLRAGNVIGGGDWAEDRLLPDLTRGFAAGRPVSIRNPAASRPWQHVLDPLNGYIMLAEKLHTEGAAWAEPWNFGPSAENAAPVSAVADRTASMWGDGAAWVRDDDTHPHEALMLQLDATKALLRLGWTPLLSLDDALSLTVSWYKAHLAGSDMRAFTVAQIRSFLESSSEGLAR